MDSIISTFHIDWKLMVAQLVNFGIVATVLWFFVFKPLNKIMAERTKTIEKSLSDAKAIESKLAATQQETAGIIKASRQDAQKIIQEAKILAEKQQAKTVEETQAKVKKIVEESKKQIALEKDKMVQSVQAEIADVVVLAAQQVLKDVSDKKIDKELVHKTLANIDAKR